jgi:hypothetical protein
MTDRTTATRGDIRKAGFDRRLIPPMMLGSVLNPINSTVIAVGLVPIGAAFGAPPSQTAWLVSALYLATALGQPIVGRLIDIFGPRRLFLLSTSLVGVAGVVGTLAPGLGVLIAARVLLGFGTCAGYPAAMALLRTEAARTGQDSPAGVLTALAVANQTVAVVGPLLGGLLRTPEEGCGSALDDRLDSAPLVPCPRVLLPPATRRRPGARGREAAGRRDPRAGVHHPPEHAVRGAGVRGGARPGDRR